MKEENKRDLIMLGELLKVERDVIKIDLLLDSMVRHKSVFISFYEFADGTAGEQQFRIGNNSTVGYTAKISDIKQIVYSNSICY